jgi:predicted secreted Zn-dependent protease
MIEHHHITRLLLVFCLLPSAALAEPETRINNVYYQVDGSTAEDIWADILAKSPVKENGKQHVAYTRWDVSWKFWWYDHGSSCEISKVTTRLDVAYTLPRLKQSASIPQSVTAHWEKYYAALLDHEQGHKALGVKAAIEIEHQLLNMGPRRNCEQLELDANKMARNVIDKYSQLEKEYDRSTNHGLNTGAVYL